MTVTSSGLNSMKELHEGVEFHLTKKQSLDSYQSSSKEMKDSIKKVYRVIS